MVQRILDEREIQGLKEAYMSDNSTFMKWSTEIEEKKGIIDEDFMRRNSLLIIGFDKFAPLANFNDPILTRLHKLKMMIISLELEAGLQDAAEQTAMSILDDIQISRGDKGFYQKALITQRHEMQNEDRTAVEKKVSFVNKLFSKKESSQPPQQGGPVQ